MTTNLVSAAITRPSTSTKRTFGQRLGDWFNVKDFGAVGNGSNPDDVGIQAAITAAIANNGGTVYFPAGEYAITQRVTIPGNSDAALTLLGDGANLSSGTVGSTLAGAGADYLIYIGHSSTNAPHMPVKLIQGLAFGNGGGTITSVEPTPDGDGNGGLYIGSACTGMIIKACDFGSGGGVCLFSASNFLLIEGTGAQAGYSAGQPANSSFGIVARSAMVVGSKIFALGTAFEFFHGMSVIDSINNEVCGIGVNLGQNTLSYWEPDANSGNGAIIGPSINPVTGGLITSLGQESIGLVGVRAIALNNFVFSGVVAGQFDSRGRATHGLYGGSMRNCVVEGLDYSGGYSVAGVALGQQFNAVLVAAGSWTTGTTITMGIAPSGGFPGGVGNPGTVFANDVVYDITTSQVIGTVASFPTGIGPVTLTLNAGAAHPSSGSSDLLGFSTPLAATGSWTTSNNTISMTANPGLAVPNMRVFDVTNSQVIGTVLTFPTGGTTLTLTANAMQNSSGSSDSLIFLLTGGDSLVEASSAAASGGGVPWQLPISSYYSAGDGPLSFKSSGTDGGVTFANLPPSPAVNGSSYVIITDCNDPEWTGTVSNIGKPITSGGGTNRVMARYFLSNTLAAGGSWTTGNNTITMGAANPGQIVPGMIVIDTTLSPSTVIGTVSTWPTGGSTTLTLTGNAAHASSGSTDGLTFSSWVIAG